MRKLLILFAVVAMGCETKERETVFVNLELNDIKGDLSMSEDSNEWADSFARYAMNKDRRAYVYENNPRYCDLEIQSMDRWVNRALEQMRDDKSWRQRAQVKLDSLISKINNPDVKIYMP
jgi:hypothetical protein